MTGIILAAGLSSRMGSNKLLLPLGNGTILSASIANALDNLDSVIIVTGHERARAEEIAAGFPVRTIYCPAYMEGQRASTLAGIEAVDDDFAIIPGDLPLISADDFHTGRELLRSHDASRPMHGGIPGHPVTYRKENRERLLSSPLTMKEYLRTISLGSFEGSIGTILDADTPDDYARLSALYGDPAAIR